MSIVYKDKGPHQRPGGTFSYKSVSEDQLEQALKDGWCKTLPEAIAPKAAKPAPKAVEPEK